MARSIGSEVWLPWEKGENLPLPEFTSPNRLRILQQAISDDNRFPAD